MLAPGGRRLGEPCVRALVSLYSAGGCGGERRMTVGASIRIRENSYRIIAVPDCTVLSASECLTRMFVQA